MCTKGKQLLCRGGIEIFFMLMRSYASICWQLSSPELDNWGEHERVQKVNSYCVEAV